jgi:tetratricopeptide (TPR) repeat protein
MKNEPFFDHKHPMPRKSTEPRSHKTLIIALLASTAVAVIGAQASRGMNARRATAPISSIASPTNFLAALPTPIGTPSKTEKDIAKWKATIEKTPTDASSWVKLGDGLMQKARESANHQYYDWAEKAYQQSLNITPNKSDAMTGMAWVAGGRHQFDKSIEWSGKSLAINPKDDAAYGLMGDAQLEQGDYKASLATYQKMLDTRPNMASYSRGAHLLYLMGDTRKAMWLMTKAIKAGGPYSENTAWCNAKLAEMLLGEGAVLPAENILKDAIKVAPNVENDYVFLATMGLVKAAQGKYTEAITLYEKANAIAPQHAGLVALGDLYTLTKQPQKAEETFALIEKTHEEHLKYGNSDELYMARFWADHDRQLPRALAIAEAHKDAKNAVGADTVAWVFYKNNNLPEAKATITRAMSAIAPDASTLFHAGMIHTKLGEANIAKKYLYQAMSRNSHFSLLDAPIASETLQKLGGGH